MRLRDSVQKQFCNITKHSKSQAVVSAMQVEQLAP